MQFDILTIFPPMFEGAFDHSIIKRSQTMGLAQIDIHNIRDHAHDKHHVTDDTPYGGGGGMVMKPDPIFQTVEHILDYTIPEDGYSVNLEAGHPPIILLSPQGQVFTQKIAEDLMQYSRLLFICGRYEGVDERVVQYLATQQLSIGDYVLSGGEIPAMVIVDALIRLIPGVLGDPNATTNDSHATGLLEYPHYTRPAMYKGHGIPEVLLSGNHAKINQWRREQSLKRTLATRPDLLETAPLSEKDKVFLEKLQTDGES